MSVATDLQTIAENVPRVYAAGRQKQYDDFWDSFQEGGNRSNYQMAFAGNGFTDDILKPKYPIPTITANNAGRQMFIYNTSVTEIAFPLSFSATTNGLIFAGASSLRTITSLTVTNNVNMSDWFNACMALENLTIHGEIGSNVNLSSCTALSVASAKSVLSHLSANGTGKTVTFASALQSQLNDDDEAVVLIAFATARGWTIAFA